MCHIRAERLVPQPGLEAVLAGTLSLRETES